MTEAPETILPKTCELIRKGIADRLHLGMQVYISHEFKPVADFALGENAPGQLLTPEMILPWLSAGKPITAVAVMQQVELNRLQLDTPVCEIIPDFAAADKERITIEQLLTHTAGLKPIATGWPKRSWQQIIEKICQTGHRRDRGDGLEAAYDPARSWFILGEILQRLDPGHRPIDKIVRQEILEPLGMWNSWMAIPENLIKANLPRLAKTYLSANHELVPAPGNTEEYCQSPSPGGSMRGPIRELGLFYEMLLRGGMTSDNRSLLSAGMVKQLIRRRRKGEFDATFQHQVDFGLGVIVNSNRYGAETVPYGFGRHASPDSFGHGGAQSSIAFADPDAQLVVAAVANGLPGDDVHNQRFRDLNSAIYEDLGIEELSF